MGLDPALHSSWTELRQRPWGPVHGPLQGVRHQLAACMQRCGRGHSGPVQRCSSWACCELDQPAGSRQVGSSVQHTSPDSSACAGLLQGAPAAATQNRPPLGSWQRPAGSRPWCPGGTRQSRPARSPPRPSATLRLRQAGTVAFDRPARTAKQPAREAVHVHVGGGWLHRQGRRTAGAVQGGRQVQLVGRHDLGRQGPPRGLIEGWAMQPRSQHRHGCRTGLPTPAGPCWCDQQWSPARLPHLPPRTGAAQSSTAACGTRAPVVLVWRARAGQGGLRAPRGWQALHQGQQRHEARVRQAGHQQDALTRVPAPRVRLLALVPCQQGSACMAGWLTHLSAKTPAMGAAHACGSALVLPHAGRAAQRSSHLRRRRERSAR